MSFFLKSEIGWISIRYKSKGITISHACGTKKIGEAKQIKEFWDMEYKLGRWNPFTQEPPNQVPSINQIDIWFDKFFNEKKRKKLKPKSLSLYSTAVQSYVNYTKHRTIEQITSDSIDDWLSNSQISFTTKKTYLTHLSIFLSYCKKLKLIYENPALEVEIEKDKEPVKDWLTIPEYNQFLSGLNSYVHSVYNKHAPKSPIHPMFIKMVEFIVNTGCRISEVCNLHESDIRPDFIVIYGKGDKERKIPLHDRLKGLIEEILLIKKNLNIRTTLLFSYNGSKIGTDRFSKSFRRYADKLGVRKSIHVHSLRRTCATWLRLNGVPVDIIKEILGHSEIRTTEIYLDIQNSVVNDAMNKAFHAINNSSLKKVN